ncbi:DUF4013 domain-containing protein [Halorussus marinus]|uniref:DUF4013 domain-containing protein n=1 Tax=Halorussus marinus TaxID=2505976 RepID=UPI00109289B9|nr:DUF4013 domain-containing protein [Halorussus marinus]
MFETALTYLVESDDGVETTLTGSILTLLAWLLIPAIVVAGYFQRALAATNAGEPAPSFGDWGGLFGEGLRAIGVVVAYAALPVVLLGAVLASLLAFTVETTVVTDAGVATDPRAVVEPVASADPGLLGVAVVFGGLALAGVTGLVAWYVLPAALARLAVEGRFGAAFELRELASVVATAPYATGWLLALAVLVVDGAVVGALASIPFLGWALAPFAIFYFTAVAVSLYGQGYREATRAGGREAAGDRRTVA